MADLEKRIDKYLRSRGQVPARAPGQYESQKRKLVCGWCGREHGAGYVGLSCPIGPRHNACVMPHNTHEGMTCQHRDGRAPVCGERVQLLRHGQIFSPSAYHESEARQRGAEALRLSQDPSRCWRCGEKESDCRCAAIGNYAGYGGKRRHGGGRIHSYIEGYMSAPPSPQYEHLRNAIVRHAGKSWSVDQVSGDEAYLRPLGNQYGEGCKTVKCRELKKAGGGKRRSAAVYGPRGGVTEVQSLLFPRSMWTEERAKSWAKRNGKLYGDVDVTDKFIRLRQADPDSFKRMRTKCLMRRGGKCVIKSVIGIRR